MIVNNIYCSIDSLDKFYFYCTNRDENSYTGIRVGLWEDGEITIDIKTFENNEFFGEEEEYEISNKELCVSDMFDYFPSSLKIN